jgi:hypothetical protein
MAVPSTICGKVTLGSSDFAHITSWRFSKSGNVQTYTSSSGAGHQLTLPGQLSGEVSFDAIYDPADDLYDRIRPNDQVTLLLYVDATRYHSVPCRINDMDDEVNIAEGSPPTIACTAQSHGQWTYYDGQTSDDPCT